MPPMELMGMESVKCVMKNEKWGLLERIQPVTPTNFLYNMVNIFAKTSNALTPSGLRTPFGARHESTGFCRWVSSTGKGRMKKVWIRAPFQKWPKKMPGACPAH